MLTIFRDNLDRLPPHSVADVHVHHHVQWQRGADLDIIHERNLQRGVQAFFERGNLDDADFQRPGHRDHNFGVGLE